MEKYTVKLTEDERIDLLSLIKIGKGSAAKLTHARILLAADERDNLAKKKSDVEIGKELHLSYKTVARARQRFVEEGLESALSRKPHSNPKPRKMDGDQEAHLIALSCSNPPDGRSRWTLKLLANRLVELDIIEDISSTTVGRVLKKTK
jgi:transposase